MSDAAYPAPDEARAARVPEGQLLKACRVPGHPSSRIVAEEITLFRSSKSLKRKLLLAACCFTLAVPAGAVVAAPVDSTPIAAAPASASPLVRTALSCPPGTHVGYEGKYCWPNRGRACPPGYHLGYEKKYCWPD